MCTNKSILLHYTTLFQMHLSWDGVMLPDGGRKYRLNRFSLIKTYSQTVEHSDEYIS